MDPYETKKGSDEIDLTDFFRWIGRGFKTAGHGFLFALASIRNLFFDNRLFFGGIIVIGLLLGAAYSELLKKKFYKSSMVISCDYLNTQILKNTIEKLNLLAGEPEGEGLMNALGIEKEIAVSIGGFDYTPFVSEDDVLEMEVLKTQLNNLAADKKEIVEKVISKLEIDNKNAYEISVLVFDPEVVKPLEKAIVTYFSENLYIKKRVEINKVNLKSRKAKLLAESKKLDSLKKVVFENYQNLGKTSKGSGNVILGDEKLANPLEIYREDLDINTEILMIDSKLFVSSDFEVVDGFTTFKQPESAGLFKILFIAFFLSIIMGYLIIGAWKFDTMLSKIDTKSKD